jgi:hypothetical protein
VRASHSIRAFLVRLGSKLMIITFPTCRGEAADGASSPSRMRRSPSMASGGEDELEPEGQDEAQRGPARKRKTAKRVQGVMSMNEWEQVVDARRRSQAEPEAADEGRRGSSYSPKAEGGRRSRSSRSIEGGGHTGEQAEGGERSLRRVRGSRQEGGTGGEGLPGGRSASRNSRSLRAEEASEQAGDAGGKASRAPRRRQRSVQRDMDGEEEAVNAEYLI